MSYPPQGAVAGDMTKAVYDPDKDGLIAVGEMEMTASKVAEGQGLGSSAHEIDTPGAIGTHIVGDVLIGSVDTEYTETSQSYVKKASVKAGFGGALRIKFDIKTEAGYTAYGKVYRNGSPVGTEQSEVSDSYVTKSEDIAGWSSGDTIELWVKTSAGQNIWTQNFRVYAANAFTN